MGHESLADKAVSTVAAIDAIEVMLEGVNDYGDATGYCQEHADLVEDAHAFLGTLRRRAYTLRKRFERNKALAKALDAVELIVGEPDSRVLTVTTTAGELRRMRAALVAPNAKVTGTGEGE